MLFYATLLITSLVVTLVILWVYNMTILAVKKFRESRGLSESHDPTAHLNEKKYGRNVKKVTKAWGEYGHATPNNLARTHPARSGSPAPWGWPGNDHESHEHQPKPLTAEGASLSAYLERNSSREKSVENWKKNVARPVRDDRPALAGKAYSPSKDTIDKFSNEDDDRPWGW